jgi:hypothetical protein
MEQHLNIRHFENWGLSQISPILLSPLTLLYNSHLEDKQGQCEEGKRRVKPWKIFWAAILRGEC